MLQPLGAAPLLGAMILCIPGYSLFLWCAGCPGTEIRSIVCCRTWPDTACREKGAEWFSQSWTGGLAGLSNCVVWGRAGPRCCLGARMPRAVVFVLVLTPLNSVTWVWPRRWSRRSRPWS